MKDELSARRLPASGRGDFALNGQWLEKHGAEYAGQWVALRDGKLLDSDSKRAVLQSRVGGVGALYVYVDALKR